MKKISFLLIFLLLFIIGSTAQTMQWHKGQLHCHSTQSDGEISPKEVCEKYKNAAYSFVALSDHNTTTNTSTYQSKGFITIPNNELTYGYRHVNAINLKKSVTGSTETLQDIVNAAKNADADLAMINHPYWSHHDPDMVAKVNNFELLEVLMHYYQEIEEGGFEYNLAYDAKVWDALLSLGKIIYGTGTDDAHNYNEDFNQSWVMVNSSELTPEEIIKSLRSGDFYASSGVVINSIEMHDRTLSVNTKNGSRIRFFSDNGELIYEVNESSASCALAKDKKYIRAEIRNSKNRVAYTQAYFPNYYDNNSGTIVSPINNKTFGLNANIIFKIVKNNSSTKFTKVEYFDNGYLIYSSNDLTKKFNWKGVSKGKHKLKARLTNANGLYYWTNSVDIKIEN